MNIQVPWLWIAILVSLFIFYEFNRRNKNRREERREKLNDARQELLDALLKAKRDEPEDLKKTDENNNA